MHTPGRLTKRCPARTLKGTWMKTSDDLWSINSEAGETGLDQIGGLGLNRHLNHLHVIRSSPPLLRTSIQLFTSTGSRYFLTRRDSGMEKSSSLWVWKGVSATLWSGRYTLSWLRGRQRGWSAVHAAHYWPSGIDCPSVTNNSPREPEWTCTSTAHTAQDNIQTPCEVVRRRPGGQMAFWGSFGSVPAIRSCAQSKP